jgi:hypothetical protein
MGGGGQVHSLSENSYLLELVCYIHLNPLGAKFVKDFQKCDERILGYGAYVDRVLTEAKETYERKYRLRAKGLGLSDIAVRAAGIIGIDPDLLWIKGKQPKIIQARSFLCYCATNELGISQSALSKWLELSPPSISIAVVRGKELVRKYNSQLISVCCNFQRRAVRPGREEFW